MNFLKSRAERGEGRGTPIATSDPGVLSCLKSRAPLYLTSRAQRAMPRRVLEVLL